MYNLKMNSIIYIVKIKVLIAYKLEGKLNQCIKHTINSAVK